MTTETADKIITTDEQLDAMLSTIKPGSIIAYDLETTGLNVRKDKITDIAIFDGTTAYNICVNIWENNSLKEIFTREKIINTLHRFATCRLRTHNGSFDLRFTTQTMATTTDNTNK
jgi:ribonuclease D